MRVIIGSPIYSLTVRRYELGHQHRFVIYLAKVLQGVATVLPLLLFYHLRGEDWSVAYLFHLTVLFLFGLVIALWAKVYGLVTNAPGYDGNIAILDWVCDILLLTVWYPITYAAVGSPWLLVLYVAVWGLTYPYSSE